MVSSWKHVPNTKSSQKDREGGQTAAAINHDSDHHSTSKQRSVTKELTCLRLTTNLKPINSTFASIISSALWFNTRLCDFWWFGKSSLNRQCSCVGLCARGQTNTGPPRKVSRNCSANSNRNTHAQGQWNTLTVELPVEHTDRVIGKTLHYRLFVTKNKQLVYMTVQLFPCWALTVEIL